MQGSTAPLRRTAAILTAATLAVLTLLVAGLGGWLRRELRSETLRREAEALHAVATMEVRAAETRAAGLADEDAAIFLLGAALESSRLRGVLAMQLFDARGNLREARPNTGSVSLEARWWSAEPAAPTARFHPRGTIEAVFGVTPEPGAVPREVPLVEIVVPLRANRPGAPLLGTARYWTDGAGVAAEFARMDRRLFWLGGLAWTGAAAAVGLVLAWALGRIAEGQRHLAAQGADLARANEELNFAAKTGALGAVSAHLIHGLRNPLAGLEGFVEESRAAASPRDGEAWTAAVETTRRLRALVQEVAAVLRDEAGGDTGHPVPAAEVSEEALRRARPAAEAAVVDLATKAEVGTEVSSRVAGLAGLVLANLLSNAIEASSRGAHISIGVSKAGGEVVFTVTDAAGGLPDSVRTALFHPVASTKRHGGGMGLAISRRLARHAGGDLTLERSGPNGTTFALRVPAWHSDEGNTV